MTSVPPIFRLRYRRGAPQTEIGRGGSVGVGQYLQPCSTDGGSCMKKLASFCRVAFLALAVSQLLSNCMTKMDKSTSGLPTTESACRGRTQTGINLRKLTKLSVARDSQQRVPRAAKCHRLITGSRRVISFR